MAWITDGNESKRFRTFDQVWKWFGNNVEPHYLLPHLKRRKLLTDSEAADLLSKPEPTRHDTIKFLSTLKSKGRRAFSLFTDALHDEDEHLGHSELYKKLTGIDDQQPSTEYERCESRLLLLPSTQSLGCDSGIQSHPSLSPAFVSNSSIATSSVVSASGTGEALVQRELNAIKDSILENSQALTELTKEFKKFNDNTMKMSSSPKTNRGRGCNASNDDQMRFTFTRNSKSTMCSIM